MLPFAGSKATRFPPLFSRTACKQVGTAVAAPRVFAVAKGARHFIQCLAARNRRRIAWQPLRKGVGAATPAPSAAVLSGQMGLGTQSQQNQAGNYGFLVWGHAAYINPNRSIRVLT